MDHPCPKCGAAVENGIPFCPNCNAPQIRVSVGGTSEDATSHSADNQPVTPPLTPGTPDDVQPPAEPVHVQTSPWRPVPPPTPKGIQWRRGWPALLFAGVLGGLLSNFGAATGSLGVLCLCMLASGGIALTLYRRRVHGDVMPAQGFRIGASAGAFAILVNALLTGLGLLSSNGRSQMRSMINARMQESMAGTSDPASQEMLRKVADSLSTPSGLAAVFLAGLLVAGVLFVIFGGLGGTIGAALFGRSNPHR